MIKSYFNFLFLLAGSFLILTQSCSSTQEATITSKTASTSKGYTVMNPGESIIIYKYEHLAHSAKEADKYGPKYFFTTASSDVLTPLTKMNLKKVFSTNHSFHDALDANFTKDEELINYDDFHKMYKINRLLINDSHSGMKMDNGMMASMNNAMGKMHDMKMSEDFDHDFAHMMIKHHQAAIDMSKIEMAKGMDPQIKKIAQNIITEQKVEIGQMELFIKNHKVTKGEMHHQLGESMNSMMNKMNNMKMTGNADRDYVMMMIPHHECAVSMAEAQLAHGKEMELKNMAQSMILNQKKEIAELNAWLSAKK
ncbi:MAG: DUF305 domain-containing protein [Saprospiraceae bacterium]|nr:DUF305 domain-containing protein [Saprospiraceae bacterium]